MKGVSVAIELVHEVANSVKLSDKFLQTDLPLALIRLLSVAAAKHEPNQMIVRGCIEDGLALRSVGAAMTDLIRAVFADNEKLCLDFPESLVHLIMVKFDDPAVSDADTSEWLACLQCICIVNGVALRKNQMMVLKHLLARPSRLRDYISISTSEKLHVRAALLSTLVGVVYDYNTSTVSRVQRLLPPDLLTDLLDSSGESKLSRTR